MKHNKLVNRIAKEEMIALQQIPKKALTVWRIYGVLQTVATALVAAGAIYLLHKFSAPIWITYIILAVVTVEAFLTVVLFPSIKWRIWRYEVREHEIEIQSGLFIVKRALIPMVRVQHVDTAQGPILKRHNLANISISTAATTHIIPMLEVQTADALREKISEWARVAEEDV